jgi:hypothetical protein
LRIKGISLNGDFRLALFDSNKSKLGSGWH